MAEEPGRAKCRWCRLTIFWESRREKFRMFAGLWRHARRAHRDELEVADWADSPPDYRLREGGAA